MSVGVSHQASVLRGGIAAVAVLIFADQTQAQTANVTPENVAVFNLLSPFLNLNATAIGQQTLQTDLSQAVAINQNSPSAALLNNNLSTPTLAALAISDENLLGKASNAVTGLSATYGVAANLAGGLPTQNTTAWAMYNGAQPVGAFGSILGAAYMNGVGSNGSAVTLPNTVNLLVTANTQIVNNIASSDSQVAKFYFANGTVDGTTPAVAPAGYTVPTANGYPNKTTSVYDTAFGVSNTQSNQNSFGDSHPYQTAPADGYPFTLYDSTVQSKSSAPGAPTPSTNPAFPSSHMAYATTDSLLLGMMVPQLYQSMLLRASEMGESRIVVGVHYPTDIIASRAFASFDLANLLGNTSYINNAAVTGTAVNIPSLFASAAPELRGQLTQAAASAGCGTSLATCATSSTNTNPYAPSANNAAVYAARLTYGLPTLSFAQAPQEQAPAGGPDASILLATVYGGSTSQAQALANAVGGGMYGNLSTNTINEIIVNTETNALAAFYGTSLSYWSRINLYAATGYFQGITGNLTLAPTDVVNTNVTVASTGGLAGHATINGSLAVGGGGAFLSTGTPGTMTVNGPVSFQAGSSYQVALGASGTSDLIAAGGKATLSGGAVSVLLPVGFSGQLGNYTILSAGGGLSGQFAGVSDPFGSSYYPFLGTSLSYTSTTAQLTIGEGAPFATAAQTSNQAAAGRALDTLPISNSLLQAASLLNYQTAPAALAALSGDIYGSTESVMQQRSAALRDAVDARLRQATTPEGSPQVAALEPVAAPVIPGSQIVVWQQALGAWGNLDSTGNATGIDSTAAGYIIGLDAPVFNGWRAGLASGFDQVWFNSTGTPASASMTGAHLAGYTGNRWGPFGIDFAASNTWYGGSATRSVALPGVVNSDTGGISGGVTQVFGEATWDQPLPQLMPGAVAEPFVDLAYAHVTTGGFTESGGITSLSANSSTLDDTYLTLGARGSVPFDLGTLPLKADGVAGWQHTFGSIVPSVSLAFANGAAAFSVQGVPIARDAAVIGGGLRYDASPCLTFAIGYIGRIASGVQDNQVHGSLTLRF
jgi:subtilase-type serine protease